MSAINYSKWDDLEISDDSDIECHPNVDKRSLIRWKQEQIHRERDARREKIKELTTESQKLKAQLDQMASVRQVVEDNGIDVLTNAMSEFRAAAISANGLTAANEEAWNKVEASMIPDVAHSRYLAKMHQQQIELQIKYYEAVQALQKLEAIESKKVTSDKLVTGFDKTSVTSAKHAPKPEPKPEKKPAAKKTQVIETLNPGSAGGVPAKAATSTASTGYEEDSSDEELEVTGAALEFSKLKGFDASLAFIAKNPWIGTQEYSDEIMAQAFRVQMDGDEVYAKNCVHQALILQYCGKLGKDGVGLFFNRIRDPSHQALKIFQNDWNDTYTTIKNRCKVIAEERAANPSAQGVETIQLQATDPDTQIHIAGPPADADPKVHEIFAALPEDFQEAINSGSLENVNKSLEGMSVQLAEEVVRVCNQVGFLSIVGDIIDTIKGETIESHEAALAAAQEAGEGQGFELEDEYEEDAPADVEDEGSEPINAEEIARAEKEISAQVEADKTAAA